jgi:PAS domain S-box-containing protein
MKDEDKTKRQLISELEELRQRIARLDVSETERKQADESLQASHRFLEIANSHTEMIPLLNEFVSEIEKLTRCDAVGMRMLDVDGNIPYEAYEGFSQSFYESESPLSIKSDQCMCINVIKGTADPKLSFYTEGGSFYMNGTSRFLATISEEEKGRTRNVCNQVGYESVALVPIRLGDRILGLIHVADHQENMVSLELVKVLEWAAMQLGTAIQRVQAEQELRKAHDELEQRVVERTAELVRANEQLQRQIEERKRAEAALRESEERYRRITEATTDYIFTVRVQNGRPVETFHGQTCEAVTGYTSEEFNSDPYLWIGMVPEEDREVVREQASSILSERDPQPIEHRLIRKDDLIRWVSNSLVPHYDDRGNLISYDGLIRDITKRKRAEDDLQKAHDELERRIQERTVELMETNEQLKQEIEERKRVEEALRESEAKYRLLIDNLPSVVYRGYADWSVEFMDKKVELVTGYNMEEFNSRRKKWSDLILREDIGTAKNAFIQALKTDKSYVREYRIQTKTGEILWLQDRGYIVCDKDGEIEYVSGVFFDVTERKRLEKTIIQREKLNTLGTIAAEVAHEIRNPLVSIGGFTRRLQQKFSNLPECDIILHESQRLERILSRIRNYLKPVEVHPQECSVSTIINDTVDLLSPEMEVRRITCQLDLCPDLSIVYSDPDILTQIFVNLILNAAEAMDKAGILNIKTFESDQDLHIEFKNPASEPAFKHPELLFMPFAEGGESIGLPLCYRLLKNMGGLLSFTPEKDYMVFTISLPKTVHSHLEKRR